MPCSVMSDLGLHSLPMSHKKDARLIKKQQLFVAFPWVVTSTGPGGFMICVFIL